MMLGRYILKVVPLPVRYRPKSSPRSVSQFHRQSTDRVLFLWTDSLVVKKGSKICERTLEIERYSARVEQRRTPSYPGSRCLSPAVRQDHKPPSLSETRLRALGVQGNTATAFSGDSKCSQCCRPANAAVTFHLDPEPYDFVRGTGDKHLAPGRPRCASLVNTSGVASDSLTPASLPNLILLW